MRRVLLLLMISCCALAQQTAPKRENLLAAASSRYVRDGADSPVLWRPWDATTLADARRAGRPLFVSICYAASYDCYRMQRETFANAEIAEMLNTWFVPVLLDAIERPDLAARFASTLPMHVVMTPSLEPFGSIGATTPGEISRMLVIAANRWASERKSIRAEVRSAAQVAPQQAPLDLRALAVSPRHDFIGGGFHHGEKAREKLLVEQARLALAYLDAWQSAAPDDDYEYLVRDTLDYVVRDLRDPNTNAFEVSQDAASLVPLQGPELIDGAFYAWTDEELVDILGTDDAAKMRAFFARPRVADARGALAPLIAKLRDVRQKRPQPFRDFDALAGWNGLTISALSRTGGVFGERRYLDAATNAAASITKLWNGKSLARNATGIPALEEDYELLVTGLVDLFENGYDPRWLTLAHTIHDAHPTAANSARIAALYGGNNVNVVVGDLRVKETQDALRALHASKRTAVFLPATGRVAMLHVLPYLGTIPADARGAYLCNGGRCERQ